MSATDDPESDPKSFDTFELATAVLLGLAALGAALASLQSGPWGGRQLDAFSAANTLAPTAKQYKKDRTMGLPTGYYVEDPEGEDESAVAQEPNGLKTARAIGR
ncbi:MAG TPA: hypothetical protein VGS22_26775 [Thermoanaerobaculia bacterium]|jgi:hypothetical protein|nr:hypothetical protein [Thermoanaerobaculia bacterium]